MCGLQCALHLIPACVSLSPSALTELSECGSIEIVPRFQTLRFNVQAHQSRLVIYWLKPWLCIHIRIVAAALVSQRAALQQDILAQGESLEAQWPCCWKEYRERKHFLGFSTYLCSWLTTVSHSFSHSTHWLSSCSISFIHLLTHMVTHLRIHSFNKPTLCYSLSGLQINQSCFILLVGADKEKRFSFK